MATKIMSDSFERLFDENSTSFDNRGNAEYNLFFLHARKKEIVYSVKARKYETLNNVCRMLGLREFEDGNYIGWIDYDYSWSPYDIVPTNPEDNNTTFRIKFRNLVLLNMHEILGE